MNFKQKFVTSTAMALTLISGYGRRSYAACVSTGAPNYLCSGTNTSGQNISGVHNAHVTTAPGFGVNTNTGNAVVITGDGDLHFVDTNNSNLQATAGWGLYVLSTGDNGATPGSVLINVNGTIFGQ